MMREAGALFVIPTPAGPVEILSLTRKAAGERGRSAVLKRDSYEPLRMSARYREFVGGTGPLGAAGLDPDGEIFILQLSGDLDSGDSWNLPVLLAHMAEAGRPSLRATLADAPTLVIATGSLAFDPRLPVEEQTFRAERYALLEKLSSALRDLDPLPARALVLLPAFAEPDDLAAAERFAGERLPATAVLVRCRTVGDALQALAALAPAARPTPADTAAPPMRTSRPSARRTPVLATAGALVLLAAALAFTALDRTPSGTPRNDPVSNPVSNLVGGPASGPVDTPVAPPSTTPPSPPDSTPDSAPTKTTSKPKPRQDSDKATADVGLDDVARQGASNTTTLHPTTGQKDAKAQSNGVSWTAEVVALTAPPGAGCALVALEQIAPAEVRLVLQTEAGARTAVLPPRTCGIALTPPDGWSVRWSPALRARAMPPLALPPNPAGRPPERLVARADTDLSGRRIRLISADSERVLRVD